MTVAPLIHIADGQSDEILGDIAPEYIIDDTHRQSLEDMLETFEFYTFGDKPFTQHLKDRNRIIIPDEDGTLREFIIYESEKYRDTEGYKMYVIGTASYLDLKKANVIRLGSFTGTASQHIGIALNDTEWRPGIVEVSGSQTIHRDDFTNPFDYLKTLAREFEGELRFRIEHNGNRITGRFVDLLERVGEWRGREIEFGKDLDGIRRIENTERIVTALIGLGPEREDGTRLEVFVEDTDALQRWGRPDPITGELRHLVEVYEPMSERQEMTLTELRQYTQTELNKRINAVVTYECSIVDLENVPGMENKQIRFGDTIKIKDTKFNPPLYIEARVFEQERSIKSKAKKTIKLGDFVEYTEEEVHAIWRQLQEQIRQKISRAELVEYAERKVQRDTIPPEDTEHLWLDTSTEPNVLKRYDEAKADWVKATPTEADEVGAETPEGAQQKADEAKQEAISYSENFTINYAQKQITSSTTPPANPEIGDLWFDSSTQPPTFRRWNGSEWEKLSATTFEELEGMINKDQLPDRVIDSMKLAIDAVQEENLSEDSVYAEAIQAEAVGAQAIAANAILAKHIAAGEVTANHLAADAVTADAIAAGAILAEHISANSITANHIKSLVGLNVTDQFIVDSQGNVKFGGSLEGATGVFSGEIKTKKLRVRADSVHDFYDFGLEIETAQWQPDLDNPFVRTGFISFNTKNDALEIYRIDNNGNYRPLQGFLVEAERTLFTGKMELLPYQEDNYGDVLKLNGGSSNHVYIEFYRSDGFERNAYIGIPSANSEHFVINAHGITGELRLAGANVYVAERLINPAAYQTTTSSAANGYVASNGYFARSTSSKRYKQDIRYCDVDYKKILKLKQASWYDKGEVERNEGTTEGLRRYYGAIAEDFEKIGLSEYVIYNEETGEVENFSDRAWVLLIPNINDILHELEQIKERLRRLENEGNSV